MGYSSNGIIYCSEHTVIGHAPARMIARYRSKYLSDVAVRQ